MFFLENLHIDESIRPFLANIGISNFQEFIKYSGGELVSRSSKRPVRTLYLDIAGKKRKYFFKQAGIQSPQAVLKALCQLQVPFSGTARELLLLKLFGDHGIPVMNTVAWGEYRIFGWPVSGFILIEEVVGREFVEVYRDASLQNRRRLMRVHGELMGTLHEKGIESKVNAKDLICISDDYSTFQKCLVVIDRERGLTHSVGLSLKQRGRALASIWVKGAFTIGLGELSELLAFLSGYFTASRIDRFNKAMRRDLVSWIMARVAHIFAKDRRFSSLRQDFKEKYRIPRKY